MWSLHQHYLRGRQGLGKMRGILSWLIINNSKHFLYFPVFIPRPLFLEILKPIIRIYFILLSGPLEASSGDGCSLPCGNSSCQCMQGPRHSSTSLHFFLFKKNKKKLNDDDDSCSSLTIRNLGMPMRLGTTPSSTPTTKSVDSFSCGLVHIQTLISSCVVFTIIPCCSCYVVFLLLDFELSRLIFDYLAWSMEYQFFLVFSVCWSCWCVTPHVWPDAI